MRATLSRFAIPLLAILLGSLSACGKHASSAGDGVPPAAAAPPSAAPSPGRLSEAERHFGVSPTFNKDVEYQPDVIVMEHGAEAIRATSSNGMTWTLDANAPHAAEIQPGRILFATGRAVGRVLAVERKGDTLDVTLGPAELTEIFEKLHVSYHGALDASQMIAYYAPDAPGTYTDLNEPDTTSNAFHDGTGMLRTDWQGGGEGSLRPAFYTQADGAQFRALKVGMPWTGAFGALTDITVQDYHIWPSPSGLGAVIQYEKNGIKFVASAALILKDPKIDLNLDILHGLKNAYVEISGVGGLRVQINGGNSGGVKNLNAIIQLPIDFSYPIPHIGAPFSVVFRQSIKIGTILTTKGGELGAEGEYQYAGIIRAGIRNQQTVAVGPKLTATVKDLAETLKGHSPGVDALLLAYSGKVIIGIGSFGLVAGPYAAVDASVGTTNGSDLTGPLVGFVCHRADVNLWLDVGVGYALPNVVVKALNTFLSLFHVKAIPDSYTKPIKSLAIYEGTKAIPPSCAKPEPAAP